MPDRRREDGPAGGSWITTPRASQIGEGTNEIQRNIIAGLLLEEG